VEGAGVVSVRTSEHILRGGGVVEALAVARAVSEHPCEGVTRGAKMLSPGAPCASLSPPSSSCSSLSQCDFHAFALCLDVRFPPLSPPPCAFSSALPLRPPPVAPSDNHRLAMVVSLLG